MIIKDLIKSSLSGHYNESGEAVRNILDESIVIQSAVDNKKAPQFRIVFLVKKDEAEIPKKESVKNTIKDFQDKKNFRAEVFSQVIS